MDNTVSLHSNIGKRPGSRNCAILDGCSSILRRFELLLPLTDRSNAALDDDDDDGSRVGMALSPTTAADGGNRFKG